MDRGAYLAGVAVSHAECSALANTDRYLELLMRPGDGPAEKAYYLSNISTCGLAVLGFWRLAGCTEPEVAAKYHLGMAFANLQGLARRFGAWVTSSPPVPFLLAGDVFIIADASGNDAHTGICVENQTDSGAIWTVEGGQFDGKWSTAINGPMRRTVNRAGNAWKMGSRSLVGIIRAENMPIPDVNMPSTGDART